MEQIEIQAKEEIQTTGGEIRTEKIEKVGSVGRGERGEGEGIGAEEGAVRGEGEGDWEGER